MGIPRASPIEKQQKKMMLRITARVGFMKKQIHSLQNKQKAQEEHVSTIDTQLQNQYRTNIKLCYFATVPYFVTVATFLIAHMISKVHDTAEL